MNDTELENINLSSNAISRREVLIGISAAASTFALNGNAFAENSDHDHSKHSSKYTSVLDASSNCTDKGHRCIAHCLAAWKDGNLDLAECAIKVNETIAVCGAFSTLLASNSMYLKNYASICRSVCEDCAEECHKHDDHLECKECGDACDELIKEIDANFA